MSNSLHQISKWLERHHRRFVPAAILAFVLLITGLWLPFHWGKYGSLDHSLTYTSYEAIRLLVFKYGQFPLYLQNINGGLDLWADPQSMTFGIFNVFPLLFGAILGHKMALLSAYILGMTFAYKLSQNIYTDKTVALLLALTYGSLGYFAHHTIEAGHSNFLYFHLLPLLGYAIHQQYTKGLSWRNIVILLFVYSQMILGGALPMLMITLCCLIPLLLASTWPKFKFTLFHAGLGIGSMLLLGIKIYPFFEVFGGSPRVFHDVAGINLQELFLAFTDAKPYTKSQSVTYHGWWEHGIGIGLIVPLLALYFLPKLKNWKFILFVLIIITWVGMGNSPKYANPWYLANTYLPVFENFRAPYRFLIGTALALIFLIPFGLKKSTIPTKYILLGLLISLGYNTANVLAISKSLTTSTKVSDIEKNYRNKKLQKVTEPIPISPELEPIQYLLLANDQRLINTNYPLLDDVKHEPNAPFVSGAKIQENNQTKLVLVAQKDQIETGLTYSKYWNCTGGTTLNDNGKLSIYAAEGEGRVIQLTYKPTYWKNAIAISVVGFVFLMALIFWGYKTKLTEDALSN